MATIKNVQLKAIKNNIGHDGVGFQANIYLNNKKIGNVLDDGWGGPLRVHVEKEAETFNQIAEQYKKETKEELFSAEEKLMYSLLELSDFEKTFKKATKKGYSFILHMDYTPIDENGKEILEGPIPHPRTELYQCSKEEQIKELIAERKPVRHKAYHSLEDFIIE